MAVVKKIGNIFLVANFMLWLFVFVMLGLGKLEAPAFFWGVEGLSNYGPNWDYCTLI